MAKVIVAARRGVTPHDVLASYFSLHGYVLPNGKTQNVIGMRECETVAGIFKFSSTSREVSNKILTWQCSER